jgi:hypothetical protein
MHSFQADFGAAKDRESLLDDMRKNIGAVTARLVKSMMAGILCTLLILITPQRILYDGVSAVVIQVLLWIYSQAGALLLGGCGRHSGALCMLTSKGVCC